MLLRCRPRSLLRIPSIEPCQFHRAIDRFRAAVRKKDAVHPGPSGEFARERALIRVMKKIRKVDGAGSFVANYFHDARMSVPERVYGDAAKQIEGLFSGGTENVCAAAVAHDHPRA